MNGPFPSYNLSCVPLGSSTYHEHQSVQLSVTAVIIFSICSNTSPEQVQMDLCYSSFPPPPPPLFFGEKAVLSMSREPSASRAQRALSTAQCYLPHSDAVEHSMYTGCLKVPLQLLI